MSPKVDLPSYPPISKNLGPMRVIVWYALAGGGSLLTGNLFHCTVAAKENYQLRIYHEADSNRMHAFNLSNRFS